MDSPRCIVYVQTHEFFERLKDSKAVRIDRDTIRIGNLAYVSVVSITDEMEAEVMKRAANSALEDLGVDMPPKDMG